MTTDTLRGVSSSADGHRTISPGPANDGSAHAGGINKPPPSAWAAVALMVLGLITCTFGFVLGMNIALWVIGGVLGGIGIVLAKITNLMEHSH